MSDEKICRAWQQIADTPEGRLALAALFESVGLYQEIVPETPLQAGISIGQRNIAVRIAGWCGVDPQSFVSDVKAHNSEIDRLFSAGVGGAEVRLDANGRAPI
jgi:hypothetical protein